MTLAFALPNKPAKLEMVLQHATELGVSEFALIRTDNSNYNHEIRTDRLEKILLEAVEQCERSKVPVISQFKSLDEYLNGLDRVCLAALERQNGQGNLLDIPVESDCAVLIGPEGGFSQREFELIAESKAKPFSLGSTILRNETAAILACGIVSLMIQR
jgi:16S rRNA (uracil1498-N3)-methyltransferase